MLTLPARVQARLSYLVRRLPAIELSNPSKARRIKKFVHATLLFYRLQSLRQRPAAYVSASVRFRGIWRNWRDAGLEHLDDRAMIRFCGFPKAIVFELAREITKDPAMASLDPNSRYWRRADPILRPSCDVLDVVVLVLREISTCGHQHVLETDMGLHRGVLGKYLARGKKALLKFLKTCPAARMGLLCKELGEAAHHALEVQHGPCPRSGKIYPYAIDGTLLAVLKPQDERLKGMYWSATKHFSAINNVLLVTSLGTIVMYRIGLPGIINDARAAEPIMEALFDPAENPHLHGVLGDYGFSMYCHAADDVPPVVRPYQPTKDVNIGDRITRAYVAEFSRWIVTCRQYNEWVNGSAKRGMPRMNVRLDLRYLDRLISDLELYFHLYNYRVRKCDWSEARTVYFEHALALFREQGLAYDDVTGVFDQLDAAVLHPDDD
jgi:hypothetical protein